MIGDLELIEFAGIAATAILHADEYYEKTKNKIANNLKTSKTKDDILSINFNPLFSINLLFSNVKYNVKVVMLPTSHSYLIISGNNYSVLEVTEKKHKKMITLKFNCSSYSVLFEKFGTRNNLMVNNTFNMHLAKIKDCNGSLTHINLSNITDEDKDELNTLSECLSYFQSVLKGYNLPEPFFSENITKRVQNIFIILQDLRLPLLHFQECIKTLSGVLSSLPIINELQKMLYNYSSNISSLLCQFPAHKIEALMDNYINQISDKTERLELIRNICPIMELTEMYSGGSRGYAKKIIENILEDFLAVEVKFETDDEEIAISKDVNVNDIISHSNLQMKSQLVMIIFEYTVKYLPGLIMDLRPTIHKMLSQLSNRSYSILVAKLREVLAVCQIPSFEVRKNKIEAVLLSSDSKCIESYIYSNSELFDIISEFFYYRNVEVSKCALEVYVRRAYVAYKIHSYQQILLPSGQLGAVFKYTNDNETLASKSELKRSNSYTQLNHYNKMRKFSMFSPTSHVPKVVETQSVHSSSSSNASMTGVTVNPCAIKGNNILLKNYNNGLTDNDRDSAVSLSAISLSDGLEFDSVSDESSTRSVGGYHDRPAINGSVRTSVSSLDQLIIVKTLVNDQEFATPNDSCGSIHSLNKIDQCRLMGCHRFTCPTEMDLEFWNQETNVDMDFVEMGVTIIFHTYNEVAETLEYIYEIIAKGESRDTTEYFNINLSPSEFDQLPIFQTGLNIILNDAEITCLTDDEVSVKFRNFCKQHSDDLHKHNITRITFLLQTVEKDLRYFTYLGRVNFEEDRMLRQIDPALSFLLELDRLRNYKLERLHVPNRRMYVYLGRNSVGCGCNDDFRVFVRCIIHHTDINLVTSSLDSMAKVAERNLIEALDAVEIVCCDERVNMSQSNLIFFCFNSILCLNKIEDLENVVRKIVLKHGRRLWSSRITQAELKMTVRLGDCERTIGNHVPIRLWVHNEGGKSLDICSYREEESQQMAAIKVLVSMSPNGKVGRYHGYPVHCFYTIANQINCK